MSDLFTLPLIAIFAISVVVIIISIEGGRWLGRHVRGRGGDSVTTLEAAILGLLALIMSFTVAISIARYDARRDAILEEANAIGTVALRATMLAAPQDKTSIALLRQYAETRKLLTGLADKPAEMNQAITRSNGILNELWREAQAAATANAAMVPTGLYIQALNDLIDNQEKRLAALFSSVPRIVLVALYGITFIATAFVGYAIGLEAHRRRLPAYLLGLLVASVILLIQDLDRPNSGFIVTDQRPLTDAADALRGIGK